MDFVADNRSDPFITRKDIGFGRGTTFNENRGVTRDGGAGEQGREVEAVASEHPEVETAAALILFAAHAHFLEFTNLAGGDEPLHGREDRVITIAMGDGEAHALGGAELHDLVGFGQGAHEGLLDIDAFHARLDGRDDHVAMLVDMPRADGDDVRLGLSQHGPVIRKSFHAAELLGGNCESLGVSIRHGDDLSLRNLQPHGILAMTIIALARMADDGDGQGTLSGLGTQKRGRQGQGGEGEEIAALHIIWKSEGS